MIALLPISRYRVTYDIATGRPYGALEALTLAAVDAGTRTVEDLSATFRVHPRLIIESLITLIHAGWIALGSAERSGYVLTVEGTAALRESTLPPSLEIVRDLTAPVVMERVHGLVASGNEVDYQTQYQLKQRGLWDHCVTLRPRFHANRIDEGQIQHLLHRPEDHWLERVGPILQESKHTHWAPVTVDLDHGIVRLPTTRWSGPLAEHILDEVTASDRSEDLAARRQVWSRRRPERAESPAAQVEQWGTVVVPEDILTRGRTHRQYLRDALRQSTGAVLICSAFITVAAVEELEVDFKAALEHDTDVDILWGYDAEDGLAIDRLKKLAYDARSAPGNLRFNRERTNSHAKLLIWQEAAGVHAVVGSFNWLSARPSEDDGAAHVDELSVIVHDVGAVSAIARSAGGMWLEATSERMAPAPYYWRKVAAELESASVTSDSLDGSSDTIKIIRDREHEGRLLAGVLQARSRLLIASHRLGPPAAIRLRGLASNAETRQVEVRYGDATEPAAREAVAAICAASGAELRHLAHQHAKFVLADDTAVVGSYNFLAADPYGTAERARELSIEIAGPGATLIWDAVQSGR